MSTPRLRPTRQRTAVARLLEDTEDFRSAQEIYERLRHRGEGIGLTVISWARALLYNGLGVHGTAIAAARDAVDCPTNGAASA